MSSDTGKSIDSWPRILAPAVIGGVVFALVGVLFAMIILDETLGDAVATWVTSVVLFAVALAAINISSSRKHRRR